MSIDLKTKLQKMVVSNSCCARKCLLRLNKEKKNLIFCYELNRNTVIV